MFEPAGLSDAAESVYLVLVRHGGSVLDQPAERAGPALPQTRRGVTALRRWHWIMLLG